MRTHTETIRLTAKLFEGYPSSIRRKLRELACEGQETIHAELASQRYAVERAESSIQLVLRGARHQPRAQGVVAKFSWRRGLRDVKGATNMQRANDYYSKFSWRRGGPQEGHLPEGHLPEGHLPEGHLPEGHLSEARKDRRWPSCPSRGTRCSRASTCG